MKKLLLPVLTVLTFASFAQARQQQLSIDDLNGLVAYCPVGENQIAFAKAIQTFKIGESVLKDGKIEVKILIRAIKCDQNQKWVIDTNPTYVSDGVNYSDYQLFALNYKSEPIAQIGLSDLESGGKQELTLTVNQADLANLNKGSTELFVRATKTTGSEKSYMKFGSSFLNLIRN